MKVKNKPKKNGLRKVVIALFSIYCIWNILVIQIDIRQKSRELSCIQKKCEHQEAENKEQERMIAAETDDEYVRNMAKNKLDFVGPDDRVFVNILCK